jgi:hypothetical protein
MWILQRIKFDLFISFTLKKYNILFNKFKYFYRNSENDVKSGDEGIVTLIL